MIMNPVFLALIPILASVCTVPAVIAADITRFHLRFGPNLQLGKDVVAGAPATEIVEQHGSPRSFNSQAVHGAYVPEGLGSVVFPIYQTSTFRFDSAEDGAKSCDGESDGFIYTRHSRFQPAASAMISCRKFVKGVSMACVFITTSFNTKG